MLSKLPAGSIGVFELFGVLIPGAVAVWAGQQLMTAAGVSIPVALPSGVPSAIAYLVLAFIVGYLAHPPAHVLNKLYDRTYRARKRGTSDPLYEYAARAARPHIGESGSVYAWAKGEIATAAHARARDIDRMEGISKMFRTLAFLAGIGVILALFVREWLLAVALLVLAIVAFYVFAEKRWAATQTVYQTFRTLDEAKRGPARIVTP